MDEVYMMKEIVGSILLIAGAFIISYFMAPFLIDSYLGFDNVDYDKVCTETYCTPKK